jgi:hypothetical protein
MWIIMSWQCISAKVTVKGIKKYCVPNAVNGTDGDMLWNDSEEDGDVGSECEEDDTDGDSDTDW